LTTEPFCAQCIIDLLGERGKVIPWPTPAPSPEMATLAQKDDDSLLLIARGGAPAAFDEVVRRYQQKAVHIANRYCGNVTAARDIAQATFVAIYRALPAYRPRGRFSSYFYRVLLNECAMAHRSLRNEGRALGTLSAPAMCSETPESEILARERERELHLALGRLSERLRVVVALRFGGDMSYQEIAEALELPLGTVKRRLFDALEKLHDLLEAP
jgi:RNA polymerase sigma-70 factor (ECF subfamily)